jgi:serine/threonine-protein kinase HipA
MKELRVILLGRPVGLLRQEEDGKMTFRYDAAWLGHETARPLSQSLPLRAEAFTEKECAPFFGGLLPEEQNREIVARNLGITPRNDYAMLREIGGECAGAVSLIPADQAPKTSDYSYEPISEAELIKILDQLPQHPLLAGSSEVRLSLAGAQNKIALRLDDSGYSIPKNESPSTHLLKPEVSRFPGLAENEAYCLKLAASIGLKTCQVEALQLGPYRCLLVNRYDRLSRNDAVERLHQEDFCQAMGIPS